ncbi:hypothetical protein DFH09DRAFT_1360936 [Mycena vulgaris]|nr:hypothetical protein DFH09DRAFT_1360936 [Mycena vulgaris]
MFLRVLSLIASLALAVSGHKPDQFTLVCSPDSGLCINQVFDSETKSTYGFVLPSNGKFSEDFIAQVSVPLPYGFAGFGIADSTSSPSTMPLLSLLEFMGLNIIAPPVTLPTDGMIVQQAAISADASQLVPIANSGTTTISPLSAWNSTLINFIFRCQNCALASIERGKPFNLVVFNSYEAPEFATPDAMNATVKTGGAKISGIKVDDVRALESPDYAAYLTAAGLA